MAETKRLHSVSVSEIECIGIDPDVFKGLVTFRFEEALDALNVGHSVTVKMRIMHSRASSVEALHGKLLEEAQGLLRQVVQLGTVGSLLQLRQSLSPVDMG